MSAFNSLTTATRTPTTEVVKNTTLVVLRAINEPSIYLDNTKWFQTIQEDVKTLKNKSNSEKSSEM